MMKILASVVMALLFAFAEPLAANCSDAYVSCLDRTVIRKMQEKLTQQGFEVGRPDGIYGGRTARALQAFASRNHIEYDGLLTRDLSKALFGVDINYETASPEERLDFLAKIGVLAQ
jgi:hypothetical protein